MTVLDIRHLPEEPAARTTLGRRIREARRSLIGHTVPGITPTMRNQLARVIAHNSK